MEYRLICTKCGNKEPDSAFRCGKCGSILEVAYAKGEPKLKRAKKGSPMSRYLDFLPVKTIKPSLGEGGTRLKWFKFKGVDLFLKLETDNPTKTFKDRGSAVEISKAHELGAERVCCASTGNMGLSVAHYARKAGIKCTIFISSGANRKKISKIRAQGASIVMVKGDFNRALNKAEKFARNTDAFVCGDYHFRKEGQKTVGYEITEQLGREPDFIFMPVGNATLFSGVYKGLCEFKKAGLIKRMPRLAAVQSEKCDPLVKAFIDHKKIGYVKPATEADAIAVGYPTFGFEALSAIRSTRGFAIGVKESEIKQAVVGLQKLGVYAELGGGTGFAGFLHRYENDRVSLLGRTVVVVVTGNNEGKFRR
jgi:threonine synthase